MTFAPGQTLGNHLPEHIDFHEDEKEMLIQLKTTLEDHAKMINRKDTGQYEETEVVVNQTFPGATQQDRRSVFRTVVDFGALPNAATKTVVHGITDFANVTFTRIYGAATQPNIRAIPIPYSQTTNVANQVEIDVVAAGVRITTAIDYSAFTRTWVVLEFTKN